MSAYEWQPVRICVPPEISPHEMSDSWAQSVGKIIRVRPSEGLGWCGGKLYDVKPEDEYVSMQRGRRIGEYHTVCEHQIQAD